MEFQLADLFESVADAVPDREAIICADRRLTYAELDERTNRLCRPLAKTAKQVPVENLPFFVRNLDILPIEIDLLGGRRRNASARYADCRSLDCVAIDQQVDGNRPVSLSKLPSPCGQIIRQGAAGVPQNAAEELHGSTIPLVAESVFIGINCQQRSAAAKMESRTNLPLTIPIPPRVWNEPRPKQYFI